jgi:hypothetical protein
MLRLARCPAIPSRVGRGRVDATSDACRRWDSLAARAPLDRFYASGLRPDAAWICARRSSQREVPRLLSVRLNVIGDPLLERFQPFVEFFGRDWFVGLVVAQQPWSGVDGGLPRHCVGLVAVW